MEAHLGLCLDEETIQRYGTENRNRKSLERMESRGLGIGVTWFGYHSPLVPIPAGLCLDEAMSKDMGQKTEIDRWPG